MLGLLAAGCQDPVDRAAKARIFSPEDPPQVIASAKEALPPEQVASDPHVAHRVLSMDAAEVVERLGPHTSTTDLSFEWSGATRPVRLEEKRRIVAGRGGVGGDFLVVQENSRDQGLEVLRKDGKVYARSRYGQFRQRLRDRGMAERVRSEVQGVMRDVDALFLGRVALAPKGTESLDGRSAWKYGVSLAPEAPVLASGPDLPAVAEPKGGRDASTLRRLRFHRERVPVSLQGEVWIDAETSVVLKAHLDGRLRVVAEGTEGTSNLALRVRTALSGVGKDAQLAVPENFLPDADKPVGIADALDRFGIPRGDAADAGTELPPEPEDE
jgi:hypothetical protein